jgi:hypothetical protein
VVAESAAKPTRAGQVESQRSVSAAFDLWNAFATEHGLGRLEVQSESRRSKLARRLAEIGGLDRFKLALSMIPTDDFLMGRVPPRAGDKPFRLDFERLMSTGSGLGDVLARMIEKAIQKLAPVVAEAAPAERLPREFWWRGREEIAREVTEESWETLINRCANGIWPEQFLGPLPGTAKCLVPAVLIKKLNLIERYGNRAEPRMVDETHGTDE